MKWVDVEGTIWPVDDDGEVQHRLRYGPGDKDLAAASILAAYAHLLDPTIPQYVAIAMLKRGRQATLDALARSAR